MLYDLTVIAGLALIVGLELRSPKFREGSFQKNARTLRNWSFLGGALASSFVMRLVTEALSHHVTPLVNWSEWTIANAIGCFLAAELIGWTIHWIKHEHGWLWRFHFQHHRESSYDVWLVSHTHAIEVVVSGTSMVIVLLLLGFSPASLNAYFLFYALATTYHHSGFDYSLGWLDKIIINPAYHRLHHAVGSNTNFGNTLTFWDVVFGTATWPRSHVAPDVAIGLNDGTEPYGFAREMTFFLEKGTPPSKG